MNLRKGKKLVFKDRTETIEKGTNNTVSGTVLTDKQRYSVDFIRRWLHFGFVKIE